MMSKNERHTTENERIERAEMRRKTVVFISWGKIVREKQTRYTFRARFSCCVLYIIKKLTNLYWKLVTLEARDWWDAVYQWRKEVWKSVVSESFSACTPNSARKLKWICCTWQCLKSVQKWYFRLNCGEWDENFPLWIKHLVVVARKI